MTRQPRRFRRTILALPAVFALLALGACSGGVTTSSSDSAGSADMPAPAASKPDGQVLDGASRDLVFSADKGGDSLSVEVAPGKVPREPATDRSIISTGVVSLRGDDVAAALFEVRKVVDTHGAEISEEQTETNDEGDMSRSRLVIRVPVAEFDQTMADLADLAPVAELEASSRQSEDVTTQVIDTDVRIRAQEASLERVEVLLARAQSIRDIVAIEAQLTRRQANLDSLKSTQAYLADQTSMSTITVHLQTKPAKPEKKDDTGFLAGLASGWHGLKSLTNGAATLLGALLPFAVVLLVLGLPMWWFTRRMLSSRRHGSEPVPTES